MKKQIIFSLLFLVTIHQSFAQSTTKSDTKSDHKFRLSTPIITAFNIGKSAEEKTNIEKYKKEYAEYWKDIIGTDGDFDLKEEKEVD